MLNKNLQTELVTDFGFFSLRTGLHDSRDAIQLNSWACPFFISKDSRASNRFSPLNAEKPMEIIEQDHFISGSAKGNNRSFLMKPCIDDWIYCRKENERRNPIRCTTTMDRALAYSI